MGTPVDSAIVVKSFGRGIPCHPNIWNEDEGVRSSLCRSLGRGRRIRSAQNFFSPEEGLKIDLGKNGQEVASDEKCDHKISRDKEPLPKPVSPKRGLFFNMSNEQKVASDERHRQKISRDKGPLPNSFRAPIASFKRHSPKRSQSVNVTRPNPPYAIGKGAKTKTDIKMGPSLYPISPSSIFARKETEEHDYINWLKSQNPTPTETLPTTPPETSTKEEAVCNTDQDAGDDDTKMVLEAGESKPKCDGDDRDEDHQMLANPTTPLPPPAPQDERISNLNIAVSILIPAVVSIIIVFTLTRK